MKISLIVAAAENGIIGRDGAMPWSMPSDLRYFRRITLGKPVIMGRKTFQSIGKPLPKRHNIVISRSAEFLPHDVEVATNLDAAIESARRAAAALGVDEIMIIGGGQVYAATLAIADRVYLTRIQARPEGDATFPALDLGIWQIVAQSTLKPDQDDDFAAETLVFERTSHGSAHAALDATKRLPT
jgi:dihydrofolate reductase